MRKELAVLWLSPVPYVVGALFHLVLGTLYVNQLELRQQALVQPLFPVAGFLLVAVTPVIAMRSFAEEARTGSLELLLAIPVPPRVLVVGKWLATWSTTVAVVAPALVFVGLVHWWGDPDSGPVVAGFLGLVLLAATLAALGTLASALSASQAVAAMTSFFVALLLWFSHVGADQVASGGALARFSLSERLRAFAAGVLDSADVGVLALLTTALLGGAVLAVEGRRAR